jgi:hypothetical protein
MQQDFDVEAESCSKTAEKKRDIGAKTRKQAFHR